MKRCLCMFTVGTIALAVGCIPEKRIVWSPDGSLAVIRGDAAAYLTDAQGNLSPAIQTTFGEVAWLPDSRRFAAVVRTQAARFEDLAPLLPDPRRRLVEGLADEVRRDVLEHEGDWDKFKPAAFEKLTPGEQVATILYIRDHRSEGLAEKLGAKWDELQHFAAPLSSIEVFEVNGKTVRHVETRMRLVDDIKGLRVSPDGRALACCAPMADGHEQLQRLFVLSLGRSDPPREIADHVAPLIDWTADGRSVIYTHAPAPADTESDFRLAALRRQTVRDESGEIITALPDPDDLAGVLYHGYVKLIGLPDGRILFNSLDVHLPATEQDMPKSGTLFAMDPARHPGVVRMSPRDVERDLEDGLAQPLFEADPAGQRVVITSSNGAVHVLTLATGALNQLQESFGDSEKPTVLAAWRAADDVCYLVPKGSPHGSVNRAEVVLASDSGVRCISRSWPDDLVNSFVRRDNQQSAPATRPAAE